MGILKIITAILIWSSLGIMIRNIDLPNESIIFYAAVIAGTVQFIVITSTGRLKRTARHFRFDRSVLFLVLSPLCFVANSMLFYFSFRNTTIANAVLTHYTAPIFVALLAPLMLKEKIRRSAWTAIALSSLGLWFILGAKGGANKLTGGGSEHMGIAAGALSGLAYAFLIIVVKKIADVYSSLFIIFIQNCITSLVLLPFVINVGVPLHTVPYLCILGLFHSTLAPMLYVQGFRSVKANEAAILGYFEPVGAIVLAFVFLHEVPQLQALLGGGLILYSGYIVIADNRTRRS